MVEGMSRGSMRMARLLCATCALMLVVPVLLPRAAAPAGHAQEADEADEGGASFIPGHGSARGTGVRVGPSRSGFNFTTDFAVSLADYQNSVAKGDSRGVSLGMILETVLETADEEGEYLPLPQNLRVDSRDEGAAEGVSRNEAGAPEGSPFEGAVGQQYVRATQDPLVEVETLMGNLGLEGALSLEGGTSRATTGIVAEGQREARGEASFERVELGGGAVVLEGLEWTAVHRSGAEEEVDASFTLGGIEIADSSLLPGDASEQAADGLIQGFDAANEVLSQLGLYLEAPEKVVNEDTGQVAMTPLKISLGPTDTSRELFGPLTDALQPVREPLADALIDANETLGAVFLLFDVGMGAFAGGGEVLVEIGGARAVTGFEEFENPFGDTGGIDSDFGEVPEESTSEPESSGEVSLGDGSGSSSGSSGGGSTPAPESSGESPSLDEEPAEGPEEPEEPVTSESPDAGGTGQGDPQAAAPAASTGSRGGPALLAALVALLVAAGFGGADFLRLRQSQRTIPT